MTELVEGKTPRTFRLEFPVQLAAKVDNSATLVGQWFFVLPSPHESMTPSRVISAAQEVIVKPQFSGAMGLFMVSFVCCLLPLNCQIVERITIFTIQVTLFMRMNANTKFVNVVFC